MTAPEFEALAVKVLTGEASPEEMAELRACCAGDSRRRMEFDHLKKNHELLRSHAPLAEAMQARGEVPPERMREFQEMLAAGEANPPPRRPVRRIVMAALALAAAIAGVLMLRSPRSQDGAFVGYLVVEAGAVGIERAGRSLAITTTAALLPGDELKPAADARGVLIFPDGSTRPMLAGAVARGAGSIAIAGLDRLSRILTQPALETLAGLVPNATTRGAAGAVVFSPLGHTRFLDPPVIWRSNAGSSWTVRINDSLAPTAAWTAERAISPLAWKDLAHPSAAAMLRADRVYTLSLTPTGGTLVSAQLSFATTADAAPRRAPANTSESFVAALRALQSSPTCPGDALAELMSLPAAYAESELALRLRFAVFAQLGYTEDYEQTLELLKRRARV